MMQHGSDIGELLARVRGRWRALQVFQAIVRAALAAAGAVGAGLVAVRLGAGAPAVYAVLALAFALLALVGLVWGLWPLGDVPSDGQVARFIEERVPALGDRLVTAVDAVRASNSASPVPTVLIEPMLADAARRSREIDPDAVLSAGLLRRAGSRAAAAALVLGALLWLAGKPARQAYDGVALTLFPQRVALDVVPGNATIKAGTALAIRARLVGNRASVIAHVQIADGDRWRATEMAPDTDGTFQLSMPSVSASFHYRIVAGPVTSPTYQIAVAHPPRVTRIDLDYTYPAGLRLPPRLESDSGDIYAPAGTLVRVHVFTDRPVADAQLALAAGSPVALSAATTSSEWSADVTIVEDNSYRVALVDRDGFSSPGDTEYFIRALVDRPPDVRILKPAADRQVTRLEEVDIEAQADDDYGIERLDLVYSVRGGAEKAVPLGISRGRTVVDGRHTLYLEDLDVRPGDFISYYVRGRDMTRGTRSNEARSDIFFLEVKPYEQEFALAQSQGAAAGGGRGSIDDLVAAQKDVVVATWKLDRRAESARGAASEQDIRSVSRAEAELKTRVEETASGFRESMMRDPRRRSPQRGRGSDPLPEPEAGQTLPEEDDMTAAVAAMGKAVAALDRVKTADALPHEMDALSRLLKAQAEVKRREVQRAQSGSGTNRSNDDLSTLFDKELQQAQQTNYETAPTAAPREDAKSSALDTIRDLARRQDELLKRQRAAVQKRGTMTAAELARELETLTREQSALRQRADELSRRMASSASAGQQRGGRGVGLSRSREELQRELAHVRDLVDELRGEDPMGMTRGAPGTEAFKQDLAAWADLRRQATEALERVAASLSKTLQANAPRERLAAGVDDNAPPAYEKQVDSYFKAIAGKKKP